MMDESNRSLTAEIVAIGDELTSGARLDTNSQWLSRRLGELGAQVAYHSTVGDSLATVSYTHLTLPTIYSV